MSKRFGLALFGAAAGLAIGKLLQAFGAPPIVSNGLAGVGLGLALTQGERLGLIPSLDEVHRPVTLFAEDRKE